MRVIWKFEVEVDDIVIVKMPEGAKIISVGTQKPRHLCLWAIVDGEAKQVDRVFYVRGTGHPMRQATYESYLGTVFDEIYVWHVFGEN